MVQTARSLPTSPILNGSDALADLTRNLDDQLRMDALKQQRGPSPFQVTVQQSSVPWLGTPLCTLLQCQVYSHGTGIYAPRAFPDVRTPCVPMSPGPHGMRPEDLKCFWHLVSWDMQCPSGTDHPHACQMAQQRLYGSA